MPKTATPTPTRAPTVAELIETHTVIGTHQQLATVIGHAEASGRLVSAGPIRAVRGDRRRVICTIRLRPPQRRELVGTTPGRLVRAWWALTSRRGRRTLRITTACIAIAALVAALAWLVIAVVIPTVAWVIAHGLYILGGLAALVITGGLIAAFADRCPTCGR
jgi:hypothetical protein